jgi:FkbM family methyltransferase
MPNLRDWTRLTGTRLLGRRHPTASVPMTFGEALAQCLTECGTHLYGPENWDEERFGPYPQDRPVRPSFDPDAVTAFVDWATSGFASTYDLLEDEASRQTLVQVLAYRWFGPQRVKLPLNTPAYWAERERLASLAVGTDGIKISYPDATLHEMALDELGYHVRLFDGPLGVMCVFVLKQYEYRKCAPTVKARPGDYVIDGGGCWGDTALYFASEVGDSGKVFSFEFLPENMDILRRNLSLNPALTSRIELVPKALWDGSGEVIRYRAGGPGTSLTRDHPDEDSDALEVTTTTIDDLARSRNLPRIDFIKMDIEGAELKALAGAEETLRTHRPRLAISAYHGNDDLRDIPEYLSGLGLGYRFYLEHFTIYAEETVLFAEADAR